MTPETYLPITPATRIPFPCKLKHRNGHTLYFPKGAAFTAEELLLSGDWTHYCTSATKPTGRPGEEVKAGKEADSYFPPSTLDKWTHTSNEDLNRYFAREFWNRPIDERNNTYWHDDDKTSEDDNHEWKPLPDFCNDWPAVRKILRDSKVVVPPDFHGRDPSEICRRTMIYMLMSKNPTSEQPQSAVPTASGATGEGFDKIDNNQWAKRLFSLAKELGQSEFSSEPPDCFIRRTLPSNPASGATGEEADLAAHDEWMDNEGDECNTTTGIWFAALAYARKSNPAHPTASGATWPSMEQRKEWHQPCLNQTEALSRMWTLISRLRYQGNDYNADIAEMELLPFLSAPASRPAVAQEGVRDTERLDWLESQSVEVRTPARYGSRDCFHAKVVSEDDEPHKTDLRKQVDAAIAQQK